jgi:hypothetical protein
LYETTPTLSVDAAHDNAMLVDVRDNTDRLEGDVGARLSGHVIVEAVVTVVEDVFPVVSNA